MLFRSLRIDCSAAKHILKKYVKNLVLKQIFAKWQSELSSFDFEIGYIKGEHNSLPNFLTREFLQDYVSTSCSKGWIYYHPKEE